MIMCESRILMNLNHSQVLIISKIRVKLQINLEIKDFPGGTVDKNSPANERDPSSIPDPGRFHMPQNN